MLYLWTTGIKKIYEARLAHQQSLEILRAACNVIPTLNEKEIQESRIYQAVVAAAERGNPEFIVEAIRAYFPLFWPMNNDTNIFFVAVRWRQAKVFNLIHGLVATHAFSNVTDSSGNCLLHMTGLLAPPSRLNHISGALLQMQREVQWFKVYHFKTLLKRYIIVVSFFF